MGLSGLVLSLVSLNAVLLLGGILLVIAAFLNVFIRYLPSSKDVSSLKSRNILARLINDTKQAIIYMHEKKGLLNLYVIRR